MIVEIDLHKKQRNGILVRAGIPGYIVPTLSGVSIAVGIRKLESLRYQVALFA